jgi:hypothetical protein
MSPVQLLAVKQSPRVLCSHERREHGFDGPWQTRHRTRARLFGPAFPGGPGVYVAR